MRSAFRVIHPGILTTYQDMGRHGFRRFGIPVSGAMDTIALRVANLLVGNRESEVGLEVTLMGLKMVALSCVFIAVTGADLNFTINSEYRSPWGSYVLKAGDVIHFHRRKSGVRAYLAARGGFAAPSFMGSASVFKRGLMGSPLSQNEELEVKELVQVSLCEMRMPQENIPAFEQNLIRVVMGPQADRFTEDGIHRFLNSWYRIKAQSDRMAYRLDGERITHRGNADIISEPLIPGAIQVPNDGCPIVLMVDCQVTGGYTKIANVISADTPILAQKLPGEQIRFEAVDLEGAYEALKERESILAYVREELCPCRMGHS